MTTFQSIQYSELFSVHPQSSSAGQLTGAVVITDQQAACFYSGYGDDPLKGFSARIETSELVVKCWTERKDTVLRTLSVFSKHAAPFKLTVEIQIYPRVNPRLNEKYLIAMNESEAIDRIYVLLHENPEEYPMISATRVKEILGHLKTKPSREGFVNLREEITYRKTRPNGCGDSKL